MSAVAAPFGGVGVFLLWAAAQGAETGLLAVVLLLFATLVELAVDE